MDLIKLARVRNPFCVVEMATCDMQDMSAIEKGFVKKKKCDDGSMRTRSVCCESGERTTGEVVLQDELQS